jgi:hypothetical protein
MTNTFKKIPAKNLNNNRLFVLSKQVYKRGWGVFSTGSAKNFEPGQEADKKENSAHSFKSGNF